MVFYNHTLEGETLTAIVAFPFTLKMIGEFGPVQLFALAKTFGFSYQSEQASPCEIIRQKLYDMWYAVEDSPRMHAVVPCQSKFKKCNNLASAHSHECLCKDCAEEWNNRVPSLIHDSHDQFFRYKIRCLNQFENDHKFDRTKTLRLTLRRMLRRQQITSIFKDYAVDWPAMTLYFNPLTHKLQHIYLVAETADEAKRILLNRHHIMQKADQRNLLIESIPNDSSKAHSLFNEPENVAAVIVPPSTTEVVDELPKMDELHAKIINVIQVVTQLDPTQFTVETDRCSISGEKDYRQFYVVLPNRGYVNRIWDSQPWFGCLIVSKLTHCKVAEYVRYSSDVCLMSEDLKVGKMSGFNS